jgi:hypothetical protein
MERLDLKILNGLTARTFVRIIWVYSKANAMHIERCSVEFYQIYLRPVIDNLSNVLHTHTARRHAHSGVQNRSRSTSALTNASPRTFSTEFFIITICQSPNFPNACSYIQQFTNSNMSLFVTDASKREAVNSAALSVVLLILFGSSTLYTSL